MVLDTNVSRKAFAGGTVGSFWIAAATLVATGNWYGHNKNVGSIVSALQYCGESAAVFVLAKLKLEFLQDLLVLSESGVLQLNTP